MLYLILAVIALGVVTAIINYFGNQRRKRSPDLGEIKTGDEPVKSVDSECCGQHEVCERDSLLAAVSKKIEYYDDEELDVYSGIGSGEYEEKAIEDFSEVFYTLREVDVAGWLRSLQLRNINLPDRLKDEAFLIIEERRSYK